MKAEPVIFLDVDGVLANFVGGSFQALGMNPLEAQEQIKPLGWNYFNQFGITEGDFWGAIDAAGEEFWANLVPYEHASLLHDHCRGWARTIFLTTPSMHHSSSAGKIRWLKKHFPDHHYNYVMTAHKDLFAKSNHLLIDDSDKNVDRFTAAGGSAILFPQIWNTRHGQRKEAVFVVLAEMEKWFKERR